MCHFFVHTVIGKYSSRKVIPLKSLSQCFLCPLGLFMKKISPEVLNTLAIRFTRAIALA